MQKNKTLAELRLYKDRLDALTLSGANKQYICSKVGITVSDYHKYCRSLTSDEAKKWLGV